MNIPKIEIPALRADDTTQRSVIPAGERAGVLIVDDTPAKLVALGAIVSGMEMDIVMANSGEQALRQLLKRDFALILLDVNMPTMDGFETAKLIRSRPRSEHTPIIFVTAEANSEAERLHGYIRGAVDFICSPISPEILRAKVRVFVDLYTIQRQLMLLHERDELRRAEIEQKLARLTPREREVLDMLVAGKANKMIAYLLGTSPRTIEHHRATIMDKMQADSLPDLVRMVLDLRG